MPELSRELKRDGATSVEVEEGLYDRGGTNVESRNEGSLKSNSGKAKLIFPFLLFNAFSWGPTDAKSVTAEGRGNLNKV